MRYCLSRRTAHATARNSLYVLSYACSALFMDLDQHCTGFADSFGCSSNKTQPSCLSDAPVSNVYGLFGILSDSVCDDHFRCCRDSSASTSVSLSSPKKRDESFATLRLNSLATREKLCSEGLNTFQRPRNDLCSVRFVRSCSPRIASVA